MVWARAGPHPPEHRLASSPSIESGKLGFELFSVIIVHPRTRRQLPVGCPSSLNLVRGKSIGYHPLHENDTGSVGWPRGSPAASIVGPLFWPRAGSPGPRVALATRCQCCAATRGCPDIVICANEKAGPLRPLWLTSFLVKNLFLGLRPPATSCRCHPGLSISNHKRNSHAETTCDCPGPSCLKLVRGKSIGYHPLHENHGRHVARK